ncbi:hypothetical protein YQE_06275, partial [Dendroctonus ponderosae]
MLKKPIRFFRKQEEFGVDRSNQLTKELNKWWNSLTPGQKVFAPICALNLLAIKFIVGLDTAGVLMGWKFFDHAAHLGGAATGV